MARLELAGILNYGVYKKMHDNARRVYHEYGISPTVHTAGGGNLELKVMVCEPKALKPQRKYTVSGKRFVSHTESDISPCILATQYKSGDNQSKILEPSGIYTQVSPDFQRGAIEGISRCLKSEKLDAGVHLGNRIRKYTPRECWRLMDFDDEDFDKAKKAGISNSQLYKQAGNSICVGVLEKIFSQMMGQDNGNDKG